MMAIFATAAIRTPPRQPLEARDLLNRFDYRYAKFEQRGDTGGHFTELQWYFFQGERAAERG